MERMNMPGFTAEASLSGASRISSINGVTEFEGFLKPSAIVPSMTPQECYKRDSQCTQFCGRVQDPDWRYECFSRCNIYLDNCLSRGVWTDQAVTFDPGSGTSLPGGFASVRHVIKGNIWR